MMHFKKIIAYVAAVALVVNLAACSSASGKGVQADGKTGTSSGTGAGAKPVLTVYYTFFDSFVMNNAINSFKATYPNIEVKQKLFYPDTKDDFNKTLSTEILTGEGPDIIFCNPVEDLDSISKVFSNGAFADLNDFISKDKDFKLSHFNKSIINAGVFNGKREFLPISFSRQFLFTSDSILEQNGIDIKDNCSMDELNTISKSFLKNKFKKSKYLFDCAFNFYYLMNLYGDDIWDYKTGKCNFNSPGFKKLLNLYKNMWKVMIPEEEAERLKMEPTVLMKNNIIALATENSGTVRGVFRDNSYINQFYGQDMKIIKLTNTAGNNEIKPIITDIAAINNSCLNKKYAYQFIKILLSDEIQRAFLGDKQNSVYNPVNNSAFENDLKKFSETVGKFDVISPNAGANKIEVKTVPITTSLSKQLADINNNMAKPVFIDKSVKDIIDAALKDYLSGKKDEDQTAQVINDKVELFLNE